MADYFESYGRGGVFFGNTMFQGSTNVGGARSVFVDLEGVKNDLTHMSWGAQIKNPFKVPAKFFAGDLFEMRYDNNGENPELYLLKTFKVKSQSTTTVVLYRDGYSHVPCVGDVLMKAPSSMTAKGKGYTVQSVSATTDTWTIVFNTAIDTVTDGDILVEAEKEGASVNMLLHTVNCVAPCDGDFKYSFASGANTDVNAVRMFYTPVMHGTMYISKMSPMPACVLALNKSRFNGWYEV